MVQKLPPATSATTRPAVVCPVEAATAMPAIAATKRANIKKAINRRWESIALLERGATTADLLVRFTPTMEPREL